MAIKYHWKKLKSMFMAMIDMAKAFDSVSHEALCAILVAKGISNGMIDYYVLRTYMGSYTRFQHGEWESDSVAPNCGVKQDPLSSHIFNFLVDVMLCLVPIKIAIYMDGAKENTISFADNTVLLASTNTSLQTLIYCVTGFKLRIADKSK